MERVYKFIALFVVLAVLATGLYIIWQKHDSLTQKTKKEEPVACTMDAKQCPDGSFVGRQGPNCEFAPCPGPAQDDKAWKNYTNDEFGFGLNFPDNWKGYTVEKSTWQGWKVNGGKPGDYTGTEIIIKNPQTTAEKKYQDIPIMVFTPEVWKLVEAEKVAVSAAPIGPAKLGENSKYVFATPPRWYGFTDAQGWQEAVDIVKTFKAIEINTK